MAHFAMNNPFTRNAKPATVKEVAVVHGKQ